MQAFTFVHTADLHLDSPFVGLEQIDTEVAAVLKDATFLAFNNIIDLCIESNAHFLLVAGDVFDSGDRSLRAQLRFRDGLERLDEASFTAIMTPWMAGRHLSPGPTGRTFSKATGLGHFPSSTVPGTRWLMCMGSATQPAM